MLMARPHRLFVGRRSVLALGCAALGSLRPSTDHRLCIRVPNWLSLKTGFEKEIGVTESQEVSEFREFNEGLADSGFLYAEMFDLKIQG